jgi:hypothetical protein
MNTAVNLHTWCLSCAFHDALQAGKQKEVPYLAPAGAKSGEYGGLLSVFPPEEHHEMRKFCRHGGNPRTCDCGLRSIPKEAFADIFQKFMNVANSVF